MKKILIIGAGFLQSFVIRKAKEMGYRVLAIDADPNAIGFRYADEYGVVNIVDEEAALAFARAHGIDGVLTAATDYGVLSVAYVAREMGLAGLDYEVAGLIKNKYRVRKCLYANHVDDTQQAYEISADTDIGALTKTLVYPVMVKPCDGSGSRGTSRVDGADGLRAACETAMRASLTHRAEIESFITGSEYGAESLVVNGEVHIMAVMKKWMTKPPYYAELGHAVPNGLPPATEQKVRQCVEKAIKALGIGFGSVNMDILITDDGRVYIVDVGARMGGNMIGPCVVPYGTGVDYVGAMLQNAVGDPVDLSEKPHEAVATRLLAFNGGTVGTLPDFGALEKEYGVEIYHHMAAGDTVREYHTNLDGCGYVAAKAPTVEEAFEKAEAVRRIIADCII